MTEPARILPLGALLKDPDEVKARAAAIVQARGIGPDERVVIAGDLLMDIASAMIQSAYGPGGDPQYRRDYQRAMDAVRRTGMPAVRGNAVAMAWAMRLMQETRLLLGGGP